MVAPSVRAAVCRRRRGRCAVLILAAAASTAVSTGTAPAEERLRSGRLNHRQTEARRRAGVPEAGPVSWRKPATAGTVGHGTTRWMVGETRMAGPGLHRLRNLMVWVNTILGR